MSKFTPGPWEWSGNDLDGIEPPWGAVIESEVSCGMYCLGGRVRIKISEADRTLIKASPDLFDALLNLVEAVEKYAPEEFRNTFVMETDAARAALEKAGATP